MKTLYPVVGARHWPDAALILEKLATGTALILRREPDNAFDKNAIQVLVEIDGEEKHIGYIPKRDNPSLAMAMDSKPEWKPSAILRHSANSHFPHAEVEE